MEAPKEYEVKNEAAEDGVTQKIDAVLKGLCPNCNQPLDGSHCSTCSG